MRWVYTNGLRQGCFVVAIVSKTICYFKHFHLGPKFTEKGGSDRVSAMAALAERIIDDYEPRANKEFNGARLVIVARSDIPDPEDTDKLTAGDLIGKLGQRVVDATKLKANFLYYDSSKGYVSLRDTAQDSC